MQHGETLASMEVWAVQFHFEQGFLLQDRMSFRLLGVSSYGLVLRKCSFSATSAKLGIRYPQTNQHILFIFSSCARKGERPKVFIESISASICSDSSCLSQNFRICSAGASGAGKRICISVRIRYAIGSLNP